MNTAGLTEYAEFGFNATSNVVYYRMPGPGRAVIEIGAPSQGDTTFV
jgi:hypothetical protein